MKYNRRRLIDSKSELTNSKRFQPEHKSRPVDAANLVYDALRTKSSSHLKETDFKYLLGLSEAWGTTLPIKITEKINAKPNEEQQPHNKILAQDKIIRETDKQTDLSNQSLNPLNPPLEDDDIDFNVYENQS